MIGDRERRRDSKANGSGLIGALAFLLCLSSCAAAPPAKGRITVLDSVVAPNMRIHPPSLTVGPGEKISIANRTSRVLSISFDPDENIPIPEEELPAIRPFIQPLQNVSFRMSRPGVYVYRVFSEDIIRMGPGYGRIVVEEPPVPPGR